MASQPGVKYQQLYVASNQSSKVLLCETAFGACVIKRWLDDRVRLSGNRSQPLAEYAALLDLQDVANINTPLKITLDKQGVDFIYVHCGTSTESWRARLEQQEDEEQKAEALAQHVAVNVLLALQELKKRGLVHRDVKPSNILMRGWLHFTWLSDCGLTTRAQQPSGFVKGLDLHYIPPEYITHNTQNKTYSILDDLSVLAQRTTTAADVYQLGLTIYQLVTGSLPPGLRVPKAAHTSPTKLAELLQRIATFSWHREISSNIANPDIAVVLEAMLARTPGLRPEPEAALEGFAWLQPAVQPVLQLLEQQRRGWPGEQQQALRAAKHMELVQLQEEFAVAAGGVDSSAAGFAAVGGWPRGQGFTTAAGAAAGVGGAVELPAQDAWGSSSADDTWEDEARSSRGWGRSRSRSSAGPAFGQHKDAWKQAAGKQVPAGGVRGAAAGECLAPGGDESEQHMHDGW